MLLLHICQRSGWLIVQCIYGSKSSFHPYWRIFAGIIAREIRFFGAEVVGRARAAGKISFSFPRLDCKSSIEDASTLLSLSRLWENWAMLLLLLLPTPAVPDPGSSINQRHLRRERERRRERREKEGERGERKKERGEREKDGRAKGEHGLRGEQQQQQQLPRASLLNNPDPSSFDTRVCVYCCAHTCNAS